MYCEVCLPWPPLNRSAHADLPAGPNGADVVFIENGYDPDPADDRYEALIVYLIREKGELRVEPDLHVLGLFTLHTWRETLEAVGFAVHQTTYAEGGRDYVSFACVKPDGRAL